jgi:preprotein translocase subunit SecF
MQINFLKLSKIYFVIGGLLIAASIAALVAFGLKPGIDFTGGSILEVTYQSERATNDQISQKLADLDLGDFSIQPAGEQGIILRTKYLDEPVHQEILSRLRDGQSLGNTPFLRWFRFSTMF